MKVRIYRICKDNSLPTQGNPTDAGYDVYASEDVEFRAGDTKLVPLGIIAEAPEGFHFKLFIRSSMALKGWRIANSVGIIDHLYAGENDEIKIMLSAPSQIHFDKSVFIIKKGDKIGQLILEQNNDIEWDEQEEKDFVGQSRGGFGSTGE